MIDESPYRNAIVYKEQLNVDDKAFIHLPLVAFDKYRGGKVRMTSMDVEYLPLLRWVLAGNFKNGALLIDDTSFYERNQISDELRRLLMMRRHLGVDVYLLYHGATAFPIDQYPYINMLVMFHSTDNFAYKGGKIPMAKEIEAARDRVSRRFMAAAHGTPEKYRPEIIKLS